MTSRYLRALDSLARSGAPDAQPRSRQRLEPLLADGGPAALAHAVRPVGDTSERSVHLGQMPTHLTDERADLRALEGDRGALRVVLVVGVGVERGGHDGVVVAGQARQPRLRLLALVGQPSSYVSTPPS